MAHFAEIDENNNVLRTVVISNEDILDKDGQESEELGISVCKQIFGDNTNWVQTSYNRSFRVNYAGSGMKYRPDLDAFVPRQPFPSWTLSEDMRSWIPPSPMPSEIGWKWDEETLSWVEVPTPGEEA